MKKITLWLGLILPLLVVAQATSAKKFENSIQLSETKENVWKAMTDYSTFKFWDDNVVDVRCPETLTKNQICQVIVSSGEMFEVQIVDMVENESYTLRYKVSSGNLFIKRSLKSDTPVELTEEVWYKGISKKTFEKYKGEDYAETLKTRMLDFKAYVEQGTTEGR